jgi:hypothetical protein
VFSGSTTTVTSGFRPRLRRSTRTSVRYWSTTCSGTRGMTSGWLPTVRDWGLWDRRPGWNLTVRLRRRRPRHPRPPTRCPSWPKISRPEIRWEQNISAWTSS